LPSRSKAQQKFMGMVHALKKGEMKPSDASPEVKKAADSMTKKSTKKYASTKHKGKPERVSKEVIKKLGEMIKQEVAKRDYKAEYKKFQSSTKMKKYRAELNKYNRQKGTYGNGDGKDASHKGGKIVGFEAQSKNRGRAEKSRLKKENMGKRCTVKEVSKWLKTLEEFRYRKVRNVDARRVAAFVNNGMNEEELPQSLQKKWEHKKYGREKHLANKYIETVLNVSLKESVNERSAISLNESATDFWMDMFRPGPIPNQYINQLIKKKGMLPSKSHIKRIYRDNGNPKSTDLAKAFKQLSKEKYIKKQGSLWKWESGFAWESVNERISVSDERHFGKKGIIIMIDDNGKKVSAIFKDKKNANKFNRNKLADIKKLLQLAKKTKYPKAIDESVNEISGIDLAKKVVKNKQHEKGMDLFTAQYIVQTYDAYKKHPELRKKIEKLSVPKAVKLANLVMKGR
jgi:hypothetical protein